MSEVILLSGSPDENGNTIIAVISIIWCDYYFFVSFDARYFNVVILYYITIGNKTIKVVAIAIKIEYNIFIVAIEIK